MNSAKAVYESCSIIALDRFIQATRDSGYKGTASAISELVDNSIQAHATKIAIEIGEDHNEAGSIEISICDNGIGMNPFTLRQALRFGGSTRFGERSGLGRYGMGLPNASLSQARRVCVYTWQEAQSNKKESVPAPMVFTSYLDVDEIAHRGLEDVPRPEVVQHAPPACKGSSGTLVVWKRCDRLDNRRISTVIRKLEAELGRRFRHYLWNGLKLAINGTPVHSFDPLYLNPAASITGASRFGEELRYEVCSDPANPASGTGVVRVLFSELPVHEWHSLSNDAKRKRGVTKGAGISVVRSGREVDFGWFFMGNKHKENYDDWWRCEVHFDPVLDEAFGMTHTKQQVRPRAHLLEALTPDLEAIARVLGARARKAHHAIKQGNRHSGAEGIATKLEYRLRPLPKRISESAKEIWSELLRDQPHLKQLRPDQAASRYCITESAPRETDFYTFGRDRNRLVLAINPDHPFVRDLYRPLAQSQAPRDQQLRVLLELLLLAAARSEAANVAAADEIARFRRQWSDAIATYFNDR